MTEEERARRLVAAERSAQKLFDEVAGRGVIAPGLTESRISDDIRDLANEMFGLTKHWHKRVVRSGPNTLRSYRENPPDRAVGADDIVFLDFGPIFEDWEADFGRTYVLGNDPVKHRLTADLARIFDEGRALFDRTLDLTGAELYAAVVGLAEDAGWEFGGIHSGHLVGEFPHETIDGDKILSYIAPGNGNPLRRTDPSGRQCHWILEVHLIDREREIGGFYEQLLTLKP